MAFLHPPLAGILLDSWIPFSKSPIVEPEWVLEKVIEIGRFQKTCQMENKKKKEILIPEQRRVGVINGFKPPEGCQEEQGGAWFCRTPRSRGRGRGSTESEGGTFSSI